MAVNLAEMLNDPEFKSLPKKDQEDLIVEATMGSTGGNLSDKPPELNPVGTLSGRQIPPAPAPTPGNFWDALTGKPHGSLRDMIKNNAQEANTPTSRKALDIAFGLLAGSTMPGSTPTGAATLGATTGAFPPKSMGDYANIAATGPLAEMTGPLSQLPKSPMGRILSQGALGGASMEGLHALSEGVNRGTNALGAQNPEGSYGSKNPLAIALAMGGPMLVQKLLAEKVMRNPKVKALDFTNQNLTGPQGQAGTLQDMDSLPGLNPGASPALSTALQAGKTAPAGALPIDAQIATAETRQQEIQQRLMQISEQNKNIDVAKAGRAVYDSQMKATQQKIRADLMVEKLQTQKQIDDLVQQGADETTPALIQARANLRKANRFGATEQVRQKADDIVTNQMLTAQDQKAQIIQQKAEQQATSGQAGLDLSAATTQRNTNDTNVKSLSRQQKRLGVESQSLKSESTLLEDSLIDLRGKSDEQWRALHPELRQIAQDSLTPGTGKGGLITNLMNASSDGVAAYRSHLAGQPNGSDHVAALQNAMAEQFFKEAYDPTTKTLANAPDLFKDKFSRDKIAALYGQDKATEFQTAVTDIDRWVKDQNTSSLPGFVRYGAHRLGWLLPQAVLFGEGLRHGDLQMAATAGVAGLVTITYPKLVNILLESPKYANDFHRIATRTSPNMTLANFPSLAARISNESVKVPDYLLKDAQPQQPQAPIPNPNQP